MTIPVDPIGAVQVSLGMFKAIKNWWSSQRPIVRVLGGIADNNRLTRIFVRDFEIPPGALLLSRDSGGVGQVPNVLELWPRVEGLALANLLNVMGQVGKSQKIQVIEMSKDQGLWEGDLVVLGAQAQKCFDFYKQMKCVAYYMDPELRDGASRALVKKEPGFGYGIILKCQNPHTSGGVAFLIGGYGVLGTEAAGYYFKKHCADLGRLFGRRYFGVVVRASVTAGVESTERIVELDRVF